MAAAAAAATTFVVVAGVVAAISLIKEKRFSMSQRGDVTVSFRQCSAIPCCSLTSEWCCL